MTACAGRTTGRTADRQAWCDTRAVASSPSSWIDRRVLAYAHRGGALEAPASTLYAIERAIALGATGIELDVHATSDGVLVVAHDPDVDGSTDGTGAIVDLDFAELSALDHAFRFVPGRGDVPDAAFDAYAFRGRGPDDRRFAIATLDEALEASQGAFFNLDLKNGPPGAPPYADAVARAIVRHRRDDEVIVTSFVDARTEAFSACAPQIATAPGLGGVTHFVQAVRSGEVPPAFSPRHVALQVPDRVAGVELVDGRFVEVAHEMGMAVHVWTVDDPGRMEELVALGVDGVMSDVPSTLVAVLERCGATYRR